MTSWITNPPGTGSGSGIDPALLDAKGDSIRASADNTPARNAVGDNEQIEYADSSKTLGSRWGPVRDARDRLWAPSGAIAQTFPRAATWANSSILSSGRLSLAGGMVLPKGVAVTNLTAVSATTALGTGVNQWFCLVDQSGNVLSKTVDDTSAAWAANTAKTLALSSPYTPSVDIAVYLGVMVNGTTVPTLFAIVSAGAFPVIAPVLGVRSTTGLTNPASLVATVSLAGTHDPCFYGYVT